MPNPVLELQQKPSQNIKQLQRLIMSRQMQQAIHFLQMPIMELTPLIDKEMEQNPVLEYASESELEPDSELGQLENDNQEDLGDEDSIPEKELTFKEDDFEVMRRLDEEFRDHFVESNAPVRPSSEQDKLHTFLESSICDEPTLFEHLMKQASEAFDPEAKKKLAEAIIGNFDENGFLATPLEEIAILQGCAVKEVEEVLEVIQTFDPSGVGGRDLKESLLLQLRRQDKASSLAYSIIDTYFEDLLHNRIPAITKGLRCTAKQVEKAIDQDIAKLDLHPGTQMRRQMVSFIVPDVSLRQEDEELVVFINDDFMPKLKLNSRYMRMLDDEALSQDVKDFIKKKILSAKWLLRNMMQRNDTLEGIAKFLAKWQREFFMDPNGKLKPLTMKTVAEELEVHESTVARAVSEKYIDTPRGILPLRSFFTNALSTKDGAEISSKTVQDILKDIIDSEDKRHPLSDEAISTLVKEKGIQCARRTVAKYRTALNIGSARQRKKF